MYPWPAGELDGERANYDNKYNSTSAVGCFPQGATREGVLDLAGNVWEWTRSEYRVYPYDPADGREDGSDPAQKRFTLRGGSWHTRPFLLRAASRSHYSPNFQYQYVGFRFARRPPRVKH
jgi:formylglycine-generating enzyme required for sulfatase activity